MQESQSFYEQQNRFREDRKEMNDLLDESQESFGSPFMSNQKRSQ